MAEDRETVFNQADAAKGIRLAMHQLRPQRSTGPVPCLQELAQPQEVLLRQGAVEVSLILAERHLRESGLQALASPKAAGLWISSEP